MRKSIVAGLIFYTLSASTAQAKISEQLFFVPGFTLGMRTGMMPRAGLDISMMRDVNKGDGIGGYGALVGIARNEPFEYYVGVAAGAAQFFGLWGEFTATFVENRFSGVRALAAAGFIPLAFVAIGYDERVKYGAFIEAGLMVKFPFKW